MTWKRKNITCVVYTKFRAILCVGRQLIHLHLGDSVRSKFDPRVPEGLPPSFTCEQCDLGSVRTSFMSYLNSGDQSTHFLELLKLNVITSAKHLAWCPALLLIHMQMQSVIGTRYSNYSKGQHNLQPQEPPVEFQIGHESRWVPLADIRRRVKSEGRNEKWLQDGEKRDKREENKKTEAQTGGPFRTLLTPKLLSQALSILWGIDCLCYQET